MSIKVGVVGMGLMGGLHADVYRAMDGVELVGIVEPEPQRRRSEQERLGVEGFAALEPLLDRVDALSVCTPDDQHVDPVSAALAAGRTVLLEKPLGMSIAESQAILEACPDPTRLMVGHLLRFDSRVVQAKRLLDAGSLGRVRYVRAWRANNLWAAGKIGGRASVGWFLGVHDVDLVLWLTGAEVQTASATAAKVVSPNWDLVNATLTLSGDVTVAIENHWLLPDEWTSGMDAGVRVIGEDGMLEVDLGAPDVRLTTREAGRAQEQDTHCWPPEAAGPGGALRAELESFIASVRARSVPAVTGQEALRAVEAVELIHRAIDSGRTEELHAAGSVAHV